MRRLRICLVVEARCPRTDVLLQPGSRDLWPRGGLGCGWQPGCLDRLGSPSATPTNSSAEVVPQSGSALALLFTSNLCQRSSARQMRQTKTGTCLFLLSKVEQGRSTENYANRKPPTPLSNSPPPRKLSYLRQELVAEVTN